MTVKPAMVARIEKLAALAPLVVLAWGALSWGIHADAQLKVLVSHDGDYQRVALTGSDRLARLEQGQADQTKRLDHIQDQLDVIVRQTR